MVIDSAMNGEVFTAYAETLLAPMLNPGSDIDADLAAAHHNGDRAVARHEPEDFAPYRIGDGALAGFLDRAQQLERDMQGVFLEAGELRLPGGRSCPSPAPAPARAEELRRAEMNARSRAGSLKSQLDKNRNKLKAAVEETKEVRRAAKNALFYQAEVARLEKLLSQAGVESSRRGTIMSLRMEVFRLREALQASQARKDTTAPSSGEKDKPPKAAPTPKTGKDTVGPLSRENARLRKALERSQEQKDELVALRRKVAALRRSKRAAQASPPRASARLRKALERTRKQKDTIKALRGEVGSLNRETRRLNRENGRLGRELEPLQGLKKTVRRLSGEAKLLRGELAGYQDRMDLIALLTRRVDDLAIALRKSALEKEGLEAKLAERPLLPAVFRRLRDRDKAIASLRKANERLGEKIRVPRARNARLEARIAKLRTTRAVLSKALYGSKSEKQDKARSERKRGQQRGAPGHGRTQRPTLEEKEERHNPPQDARVCSCCGKPYVANGELSSTVIEIEVKAHIRRIVRPRYRRGCDCASSPLEVAAPPVPRLFPRTPCGTTAWARILFERFACFRPLRRVAAWMADQGLAIAPGTVAGSVPRFLPLFEPLAKAILAHQNEMAVRHGDETGWRIQSLSETGRSRRAWLWISVSAEAVYFLIDPSRSAEVAMKLFGSVKGIVFLVCDRYTAYGKMARELDGKVILCWCWVHQRRDFIECAAGQAKLTQWCREWIERIASVYRLNEARLEHYDPGLERPAPEFGAAQSELKKAVDGLFAHAEAELARLPVKAREGKALRSLLKHREGLSVFVGKPQVPMDNNAAERGLRGAVIGRRLSFGSDSEKGADFTAIMYSVVSTLSMHGIDVLRWLEAWLAACAENGRKPPDDLSPWLPWSMSEARKREFMAPG